MRLAVLEAVSAGLCGGQGAETWLQEGLAMWRALLADLCAVSDLQVASLLDGRWFDSCPAALNLHVRPVKDSADALRYWNNAVEDADAALIVAPETDEQLASLIAAVPATIKSWNCDVETTRLCSDKYVLCNFLQSRGIHTIPTLDEDWSRAPLDSEYPAVIKPIDGAGSLLVRRLVHRSDWEQVREEFRRQEIPKALRQPFVSGRDLSIAGWFDGTGNVDWLPVAEQHLSKNGRFEYLGGRLPANLAVSESASVQKLATDIAKLLPGLRGYVGLDILVPENNSMAPYLVEINPRLTTSYVGYRAWWSVSPWSHWLSGHSAASLMQPRRESVGFAANGVIERG